MREMNNTVNNTGIAHLLRTHWKGYFWRVLLASLAILSVGLLQHIIVLKIPIEEIHPRLLILPVVVGGVFGFLLTTVRLMQMEQRKQMEILKHKEDELVAEIDRRKLADRRSTRLKYAIQGSNDGLWDWNIKTGKVYYSPRWEQMLGFEPGEINPHVDAWRSAIHPDDAADTFSKLDHHLSGKTRQFLSEMRLRTKNREWCWVLGRGQVVEYDDDGAPSRAVGTMTNISDRKRVEEALRLLLSGTAGALGTEFFQNLVHSLSDVLNVRFALLSTLDPVIPARLNTLAVWDRQFKERIDCCLMTGTPCEDLVRMGFYAVTEGVQSQYPDDVMTKSLNGQSYLGAAVYNQTGDVVGLLVMVDNEKLPDWKVELGKTILPIFAARAGAEIERRRVEGELIRQKERAQVTLHSIGDAVITTDADGYVEFMNPVAEAITGWSASSAVGMHLDEICVAVDNKDNKIRNVALESCLLSARTVLGMTNVRLRNSSGNIIETEQTASPIKNSNNDLLGIVVVFRDVSNAREMAKKMSWQARHDALTGLVNRREFEKKLTELIKAASQERQHHAMLYMDLDQFKVVNDTCGHFAGDEMLRQLAVILKDNARQSDTLARLGGDEFGLLLNSCDADIAKMMADKIVSSVQEFRFVWEDKIFHVGVSIGVVEISPTTESESAVMKAADMACYAAKDGGRNRVYLYEVGDEVVEQRQVEMHWVARIKQAIELKDFVLYGQRIMSLSDGGVHHYEILSRMRHEDGSIILPGRFMPAAERYNIIVDIDHFVVESVFNYIHEGLVPEDVVLSINLSGKSLSDKDLLEFILESVEKTNIKPGFLCIEITETAAIANMAHAISFIHSLQDVGILFSLDDFGSGLSSFGYLKQLPVDFLKIDGSFVKDMVGDPIDASMVAAINEIGHRMDKKTIAEFVEDENIMIALKELGVDYAQGYHIHKPEPLENILDGLVKKNISRVVPGDYST